jgi:hypothetical protein
MSRWILAAALSVTVLPAQPSVTVASISESLSGLTLIGASDPANLPAVRALIGDSALPPYAPVARSQPTRRKHTCIKRR